MARDYRFMRKEKDPIIDLMRTEAQRLGKLVNAKKGEGVIGNLAAESGVSDSCIRAWFFGTTRCPQAITTRFVMEAMGIERIYKRSDGTIIKTNKFV